MPVPGSLTDVHVRGNRGGGTPDPDGMHGPLETTPDRTLTTHVHDYSDALHRPPFFVPAPSSDVIVSLRHLPQERSNTGRAVSGAGR